MRGTFAGKRDVIMDASSEIKPRMQPAFEINQSGSHTLQSRDFGDSETLRTRLIEATVQALADGSGPRLQRSRL
jgi:hypothetical protein